MDRNLAKLGVLNDSDRDWIISASQVRRLSEGEELIQEGQHLRDLYFILDGQFSVCVSQSTEKGMTSKVEISTVSPQELIGEMSFIDNFPASATVRAIASSQILALPWSKLNLKLRRDVAFAARFYQTLAAIASYRLRSISALLVRSKIVPGPALRKVLFVFSVLDDRDIDWMLSIGRRETPAPGTTIITQNEAVEALYILIEGTLSVWITVGEGNEKVSKEVAKLPNGEIVGEMSFVETGTASATVKAADRSLLLAVPQQQLSVKLQQDVGFASRFYRAIAAILVDRLRDRLMRRGFGRLAYERGQSLEEDIEYEDELDLGMLEQTAIAGTRFDWLVKQMRG
jgi:bacteriocin-type transport-associated protein